jgi:hypothetical protein
VAGKPGLLAVDFDSPTRPYGKDPGLEVHPSSAKANVTNSSLEHTHSLLTMLSPQAITYTPPVCENSAGSVY